jgi:prepilin-type N-terminal cleavage/methylation domain-containing protein
MDMSTYQRGRNGRRAGKRAFTLIELMVVVTILALLFALLVPAIQGAVERSRIANCTSILRSIGTAYAQYVAENHDYLNPYCFVDSRAYAILDAQSSLDSQGNVSNETYQAVYDYHNLLAPSLGLGNCMPLTDKGNLNYSKWSMAKYSQYKEFRCPSTNWQGTNATPFGWGITSCYMQMAGWSSQPQVSGAEWPVRTAYFPKFQNTSTAVISFEKWTCNGMTSDASGAALPYSTHFKNATRGALGIGRNILYADWHINFRNCTDSIDVYSGSGWSCGGTYVPGTAITRGNELGMTWTWGGGAYVGWGPILSDG